MTVTPDPNVDPLLGELWALSDHLVRELNAEFAAAKQEASMWSPEPAPIHPNTNTRRSK